MSVERIGGNDDLAARVYALNNAVSAECASQFEAMVLESVLKSECVDTHFLEGSALLLHRQNDDGFNNLLPARSVDSALAQDAPPVVAPVLEPKHIEPPSLSMDDFVISLWPYLKQASASMGLDPKLLLAQAALETGWGKSIVKDAQGISSHNLFNIKSTADDSGQSVQVKTTEYIDQQPVTLTAAFKSYVSIGESVADYMSLIQGSTRYQDAVSHANAPQRYVEALQAAGYATDPQYAHKILSIYHGEALQQALDRHGLV